MEVQKMLQKDKYRHVEFLESVPIKEEKLLKLFLKRDNYPNKIKYKAPQ